MNTYLLFLRGINVGRSVRVSMAELKACLKDSGCSNVITYINSGNVIFDSDRDFNSINDKVRIMLDENFKPGIGFVIIKAADLIEEEKNLPDWWNEELARKDVLFYTETADRELMKESIGRMQLHNEVVYFGKTAVFWGKYDESEFLKSAYHKQLAKEKYYKEITIRNGNTFRKMADLARERI